MPHQTSIKHDGNNNICQARCSCGWYGPLRYTFFSERQPIKDSRRHLKIATIRDQAPEDARAAYIRRLSKSVY